MKKVVFVSLLMVALITQYLAGQNSVSHDQYRSRRVIKVDCQSAKGNMNTMFRECIGAGRANEGLRADWQKQLAEVKRECGFKYIRMHGLLSDDMGVYHEDNQGNPFYNYQYIDVLYDYIISIGMKPFVELGFMPASLASGNQTVFWWKGNITPPKDYQKWDDLISNLVAHFTDRYGSEEVKSWYFEVWNEPNLKDGFWSGTQEDYFKLYKHTAEAIKRVNTEYKVGGPATAGAAWLPEMLSFCKENAVPVDFVSTHTYGVKHGYLDEFGTSGTILNKEPESVSGDVLRSRSEISQSAFPSLELHYTEWSSSYTPADPIHDSYHQSAYILQKIKEVGEAAQSMSYWVFTDIFEEAGPRFEAFHGGFGLLNLHGIRKPAFYAYQYLNMLGETELVNSDSSSWACKSECGDVQVLLWDYTYTHPGDSVLNQMYYTRDLPSRSKGDVSIELSGMPSGKYRVEIYKTGYRNNDPQSIYNDMKRPSQLSVQQYNTLKEGTSGKPVSVEKINVDVKGNFKHVFNIHENDVVLMNFIKE